MREYRRMITLRVDVPTVVEWGGVVLVHRLSVPFKWRGRPVQSGKLTSRVLRETADQNTRRQAVWTVDVFTAGSSAITSMVDIKSPRFYYAE